MQVPTTVCTALKLCTSPHTVESVGHLVRSQVSVKISVQRIDVRWSVGAEK